MPPIVTAAEYRASYASLDRAAADSARIGGTDYAPAAQLRVHDCRTAIIDAHERATYAGKIPRVLTLITAAREQAENAWYHSIMMRTGPNGAGDYAECNEHATRAEALAAQIIQTIATE